MLPENLHNFVSVYYRVIIITVASGLSDIMHTGQISDSTIMT